MHSHTKFEIFILQHWSDMKKDKKKTKIENREIR